MSVIFPTIFTQLIFAMADSETDVHSWSLLDPTDVQKRYNDISESCNDMLWVWTKIQDRWARG